MENTKKSKKVISGLVCIVTLVIIGVIVYQNHQIRKLTYASNSANESTEKAVSVQYDITQKIANRNVTPVANGIGQDDFDELKYQLGAAEEELEMARGQLADEIARDDEASMSMAPPGSMEMLKTQEGKKNFRNSLKNGYDQTYSSLLNEMNLSPEKIDQLKELLADQQIARIELEYELHKNLFLPEEDRKNLQEQLDELNNQNDAALSALLGSEDFQVFEDYTDRSRERSMIQMLSHNLSFDDTLTGDQKKSLLESLYNERKYTYSQLGFDEENANSPLETMEMDISVYDGYLKGVEEAGLSESQETQLKKFLKKEQAMMKKSMEVQVRIASGELDPESAKEELEAGNIIIMNY